MNKKTRILMSGMCAAVIFGLAGCQSTKVEDKKKQEAKWSAIEEKEAQAAEVMAKKYAADIFKGIREKNYECYVKGMAPEMRAKMTRKKFDELMKKMAAQKQTLIGEPKYLGSARKSIFRAYFWVINIRREVKNEVTGKTNEITEEFLFFLPMSKLDGKYVVGNFGPII